jgi:hypothetical protein
MSTPRDFYFDARFKRFVFIPTGEAWVTSALRSIFTPRQLEGIKRRKPPASAPEKPVALRRNPYWR